jgi:hypothetical protein
MTAHGAFFVTNASNLEHHSAANVRQLFAPSTFSSFGNDAHSHRKSQNLIREVVTPAFFESFVIEPLDFSIFY